ncbi:hypothetical protein ACFC34_38730 [Streptomyces sp. NPDC056053]|uniref:hypothetical protein n=1 Tax=Streptomyces sp. NPDC056053 TaxID=3345696 RepID=UPI0035D9CA3B
MIRLPSSHAAITAPLVASSARFPGIPIGRSLLDGRPFHLSPALTSDKLLPSTNSIALGGLGSGKSTTGKVRIGREALHHDHQTVVIDSFGEDSQGEWGAFTHYLGGRVIEAGSFTLNPCSPLLPREIREQLIRSLVAAVEPDALTYQATHALQHALNHPKATNLGGLVDALVHPQDGMWPAATLAEWGIGVAIGLSRYTEGSLQGLFDGQDSALPPTDLPILTFDFSRLDRNSPAIPALMAAISCWAEHVWLRQSTAAHRHLVIEEAWQILLSPATSELIQRLLKNSRKKGLSLDVLMHTLSDLGDSKAADLARLCEVVHIGRLNPEEAAHVGALFGLPAWAVAEIPRLDPGQAVWKVGPDYVDIIETVRSEDEARLTDTSSRRRQAQEALTETEPDPTTETEEAEAAGEVEEENELIGRVETGQADDWTWSMPPNVIDIRHHDAIAAAREGRCSEAADLAALGERQDIAAHGINSDQAVSWLSTRAKVAELCGSPDTATHLRATVTRMGKDVEWWNTPEKEHPAPPPAEHENTAVGSSSAPPTRRIWPSIAAIAALSLAVAVVWQHGEDDKTAREEAAKQTSYKGISAIDMTIDGAKAQTRAHWDKGGKFVTLSVLVDGYERAKMVRLDSGEQTAHKEAKPLREGEFPSTLQLELKVPVKDRYQAVQLAVMVGGRDWKPNTRAPHRTIEVRPDRTAIDVVTGKPLKQHYSHLL